MATERRFVVVDGPTIHLVPFDGVRWIETSGDLLTLHLETGELATTGSVASMTQMLGDGFLRINRNTVVSLRAITQIQPRSRRSEAVVVLTDGTALPVTRRYAPQLRAWLSAQAAAGPKPIAARRASSPVLSGGSR